MKSKEQQSAIVEHLKTLAAKHGRLTPEVVIADAKRPKSPLHGEFEWNLSKAAYTTWTETARDLIRLVTYEHHEEHHTITVPAFVRDPTLKGDTQGYVSIPRVLKSEPELKKPILLEELRRAERALERAEG